MICDSLIYSVTELTADGFAMSRSLLKTSRKRAILLIRLRIVYSLTTAGRCVYVCSFSLRLTWVRWIIFFLIFVCSKIVQLICAKFPSICGDQLTDGLSRARAIFSHENVSFVRNWFDKK